MKLRITSIAIALLTCAGLLSSCPGSIFVPLPPGGGQGDYAGRFTNDDESETYGDFELSIDANGALKGDGLLQGFKIELEGILNADGTMEGFVTDTVNQLTGNFDGTFVSGTLIGDFVIERPAGQNDLEGLWDASPQT